jgi:hypothetical protein
VLCIICLAGIALRLLSTSLFNHHESWFEEEIVTAHNWATLKVGWYEPWRFSRVTYILGPLLLNEWSLNAYRAPGVVWGLVSVVLVACASRALKCSWLTTMLATATFATVKWFTISAGTAHMVGWGVTVVVALVFAGVYGERGVRESHLAAALTGIGCGVLAHEYIPFQPIAAACLAYTVISSFVRKDGENRRYRINGVIAIASFLMMFSPLIAHMNMEGYAAYLRGEHFESLFRHGGPDPLKAKRPMFLSNIQESYRLLSGLPGGTGPHTSPTEHLVNRYVGVTMVCGLFFCILTRTSGSFRFICSAALLSLLLEARFANHTREHRLIAIAPVLFMAGVVMVDRIDRLFQAHWLPKAFRRLVPHLRPLVFLGMTGYIVCAQLYATWLGALAHESIKLLDNRSYLECKPILDHSNPGDTVYFFPPHRPCDHGNYSWMFNMRNITLHALNSFEEASQIQGPAVIIYGHSDPNGIPADTLGSVLAAIPPNAHRSLRVSANSLGAIRAISYRIPR